VGRGRENGGGEGGSADGGRVRGWGKCDGGGGRVVRVETAGRIVEVWGGNKVEGKAG